MYCFAFEEFKIEIFKKDKYTVDSTDNDTKYDLIYQHPEDAMHNPTSKYGIVAYKGDIFKSALLLATGGGTAVSSGSAVVDNGKLIIVCCNKIFNLQLPGLELNWIIEADMATCFSIHQYKDSYIIHGELEISHIDRNGKIIWQTGARDIFVNIKHQGNTFQMQDNYIELMDWGGFRYKLFYNGKMVDDGLAPLIEQ